MNNITLKVFHENNMNKLTIIHKTKEMAKYKIYRRLISDCFGHYTNEPYELLGTATASDGLLCLYEDAGCYRNDKPMPPAIIYKCQTARNKYQISIDNRCTGYQYEYYVVTDSTGITETSDKVRITTSNPIIKTSYNIKQAKNKSDLNVPDANAKFIDMNSDIITVTLQDGYNAIFFKSTNTFNNEGDVSRETFYIQKDNPHFPNIEINTDIPIGVRYNNRYRGPQESKKIDFFYIQAKNNINKLYKKIEKLDKLKQCVLNKPNYNVSKASQQIEEIENSLNDILEDIRYEQRNN